MTEEQAKIAEMELRIKWLEDWVIALRTSVDGYAEVIDRVVETLGKIAEAHHHQNL